jgi:hypothetical protein
MSEKKSATKERLREVVSKETTSALAASFGGEPFYLHDVTASLARALGQLGMLGLSEPPTGGAHVHDKVFSSVVIDTMPPQCNWICAGCLEEGRDFLEESQPPTYRELLAKKRERSG